MNPAGHATDIADFAAGLRYDSIPEAVRERARIQILDAVGVGFAANAFPFAAKAMAGIAALGGNGDCRVVGRPERLAVRDAALANGVLMHGLDFDDTHLASIVHASVATLPCALALGEELDADGETLMAAYVAGMEVAIRIGLAARGGFHHAGFHGTGVISHFSSTVVAARLLGLDAAQLVSAQGIAASTASGVQVFLEEGAWTKRFHPGWGAVAGITAATLAKHDFVGPSRPYEGKFGLFQSHLQAHLPDADMGQLSAGLGSDWKLAETAIKPYPVCHFAHGAADAAIGLHEAGLDVDAIRAIRILLPAPTLPIVAEPVAAKARPQTEYAAKFSAPFIVATCLRLGHFGLAELRPEAMADERTLALCALTTCAADPETGYPDFFSGGVELELQDGRRLRHHVRVNSGAGQRQLDRAGALRKYTLAAGMHLTPERARETAEAVLAIDRHPVRKTMLRLGDP
ncbi:MmgE/PrpD family protein [Dankookia rubra]|uniref:MmgE/PrpD family protein n=1 Tax=Dankookia rubra TaxID=1442381 RepID=A0A4R5QH95_9PROT|nr:MmgE/PrpD family protein [Dankookia rubra]TDH62694.1 MmgE/PrpD family protein [Dankookia rubra]